MWASARTRAALKDIGGDFVFLLNQCPPAHETARVQDGVETLEEMGGLISPLILSRVDYQEAARHGWGVTELDPYGAAAEEMRGLWQSIKRRLARGKTRPRPQGGMSSKRAGLGSLNAIARAAFLPPLAQIGRTLPGALPFFCPDQPPSRVRIVSPPR